MLYACQLTKSQGPSVGFYSGDILGNACSLVRSNKGSAGIDGVTFETIEKREGVSAFIAELEDALKNKTYQPDPVKLVMMPKSDGSQRPLGIPTILAVGNDSKINSVQ